MIFVVDITTEDDFSDILGKLRAAGTHSEITMHVAKDALLFSELQNLIELKKRTDAARKNILIETADRMGATFAKQAGYRIGLIVTAPAAAPLAQKPIEPPVVSKTTNRVLAAIFSLAMIVLLLLAFVILPEANIIVYAKTEELSRDMQVTIDPTIAAINPQQLVVPGTKINNAEQYSQSFKSTGTNAAAAQIISQVDISAANSALQKQVLAATEQQLLTSKQLTLLDAAASLSTPNITFDHPLNAVTPSFNGTINATVNGVAFSKLDLVKLVEQRIALTLDPGMYLVTDLNSGNAETVTESFGSYSAGNATEILMVHVSGLIASNVDTSQFASQFKGRTIQQIQAILNGNSAVQGADINFKPFWVRNAPSFLNKIYITTEVQKPQANPLNIGE